MFGTCTSCKHEKNLAERQLSPIWRYTDQSSSSPGNPDASSDILSNLELEIEPENSVGDDSGIFLDDDGVADYPAGLGEDVHMDELELFDLITF